MTDEAVHRHSPPEAKIALFRSLFRGRDDVYARRFESKKTGKVGYQPACGNEWDRVLCDKKRVKCPVCQNRRFLPLTDEVIRRHLSGRDETGKDFVVGVYPMLQDETCFFLAVDFDKECWRERARSASEAFLYRRLETLPETVGKFRLNAELPIPFDGWGRMEVDLLSADARVAVELDGAQHLSDPLAYRRDRRKDLLLQQNGYVVVRFLAEDVSKQLDEVLDSILRILANRNSPRPAH